MYVNDELCEVVDVVCVVVKKMEEELEMLRAALREATAGAEKASRGEEEILKF